MSYALRSTPSLPMLLATNKMIILMTFEHKVPFSRRSQSFSNLEASESGDILVCRAGRRNSCYTDQFDSLDSSYLLTNCAYDPGLWQILLIPLQKMGIPFYLMSVLLPLQLLRPQLV